MIIKVKEFRLSARLQLLDHVLNLLLIDLSLFIAEDLLRNHLQSFLPQLVLLLQIEVLELVQVVLVSGLHLYLNDREAVSVSTRLDLEVGVISLYGVEMFLQTLAKSFIEVVFLLNELFRMSHLFDLF